MTENYEDYLISTFNERNLIYKGHFLLTSGKHSDFYINKDAIYAIPDLFSFIVNTFSSIVERQYPECDVITGPAIAGAVIAAPVAIKCRKTFVYPEKAISSRFVGKPINSIVKKKIMKFNRNYDKVIENKKVVIIEDVVTTGGSVQKTSDAITLCGGECIGVLSIWNRTGWKPKDGIEILSLINKFINSWVASKCPLCNNSIPLINPKTGKPV